MTLKYSRQQGFTLVELMITLVLLTILLSFAVPSYRGFQASQQVHSVAADLLSALNLARSEAVKTAANVTLAPAVGGWNNGWSVSRSGTEVRSYPAPNGVTVSGPGGALTYSRDGRVAGVAAFTVAPVQVSDATARYVCVSLGGKPKTKAEVCP